jgi:multisubunit Na+/H+ antiporter MnhC subunit
MTDSGSLAILLMAGTLFALGLASLIAKSHLIKMIMGLEFCGKGVSLLFLLGGYVAGDTNVSQAVVFTLIVIEAVIAGVALALSILLKKVYGTLDFRAIFLTIREGGQNGS